MIVRRCFKRIDHQKSISNKNSEPDTSTSSGSKKLSIADDSSTSPAFNTRNFAPTLSSEDTKISSGDEKKTEERQKSRSMRFVGRIANEGGISGAAKKRLLHYYSIFI